MCLLNSLATVLEIIAALALILAVDAMFMIYMAAFLLNSLATVPVVFAALVLVLAIDAKFMICVFRAADASTWRWEVDGVSFVYDCAYT